jgi:regulator of protease activity HflC (stomatin/prohibitin superfamily)
LRDIILPPEFVAAVTAKEVAQERQEESLRLVDVAENEASAVKRAADGTAYALSTVAAAEREQQELLGLSPTEYVWYQKWNGVLPSTLLGDAGNFIVDLPQGASTPPADE